MTTTQSPVLEMLSDAHRGVTKALNSLEETAHDDSEMSTITLRNRLGTTFRRVCEHFRLEERDGFLHDVQNREPRLTHIAYELIAEQHELRRSLDVLIDEARASSRVDEVMREKIRSWIVAMRRHEVRENDLMQDAVDLDIGVTG